MLKVLYEDNHLIAVFKPAGVLSQGDKTGDISIFEEVKKYLKEKYKKPGNVFLGLVHRLDRPVSGIILFAKTSKGAARLSEQFRNHKVEKTYHAIVIGKPDKNRGVLINNLIKDEKLKKARSATGKNLDNTKEAKLYYEVVPMPKASRMLDRIGIKSNNNYSLLKIKLETGKFHQIRSQLALAGLPILGDVKYGYKSPLPDKSVALCATGISFYSVTENKKINLSVPIVIHRAGLDLLL